jgi:hypothetical protein
MAVLSAVDESSEIPGVRQKLRDTKCISFALAHLFDHGQLQSGRSHAQGALREATDRRPGIVDLEGGARTMPGRWPIVASCGPAGCEP